MTNVKINVEVNVKINAKMNVKIIVTNAITIYEYNLVLIYLLKIRLAFRVILNTGGASFALLLPRSGSWLQNGVRWTFL